MTKPDIHLLGQQFDFSDLIMSTAKLLNGIVSGGQNSSIFIFVYVLWNFSREIPTITRSSM